MKQKDIALLVVIGFISVIISFIVSGMLFGSPSKNQQQAEVVQPISANLPPTDNRYFNDKAFDPTQPITIGQNANPDPFQEKQ
jgi:hypothetical protein